MYNVTGNSIVLPLTIVLWNMKILQKVFFMSLGFQTLYS